MFRKVGLIMNPDKPEAVEMARVAESFFKEHGIQTFFLHSTIKNPEKMDLILTFGGDGTFLSGARIAMDHDIPLMGINMGTMGFLTE